MRHVACRILMALAAAFATPAFAAPAADATSDLLAAYAALDAGDTTAAYAAFGRVADADATLAETALFEMMTQDVRDEDPVAAGREAARLLEAYPESVFAPQARRLHARGLIENNAADKALALADAQLTTAPEDPPASWTLIRAQALAALGRAREAMAAASLVAYEGTTSDDTKAARELVAELSRAGLAPQVPSAARFRELFDRYYDKGWFQSAGWMADRARAAWPQSETAKELTLRQVGCLIFRDRWGAAKSALAQASKDRPASAAAAAYETVYQSRVGRLGEAGFEERRAMLLAAAKSAGDARAAAEARFTAGKFSMDAERFREAAADYDAAAGLAGESWLAGNALWQSGFASYLARDYALSAKQLARLEQLAPDSKDLDRALYWRARALEETGDAKSAEAVYWRLAREFERTYYGLAAEIRLEMMGYADFRVQKQLENWFIDTVWARRFGMPILDRGKESGGGGGSDEILRADLTYYARTAPANARGVVEAVCLLLDAGRRDRARTLVTALAQGIGTDPRSMYYLSLMFALAGDPLQSIRWADAAAAAVRARRLWDPHGLVAQRQYPMQHWDEIRRHAEGRSLDPYLVIALVKQESAFQIEAHSWAGARGLMQVIPSTGRYIASRRGIKSYDLFDPDTSLDFGTWYFAQAFHGTGRDVARTLAGYNAGPGRATQWWAANDGRRYEEVIERIPFEETRNYVKIILRNWEMYGRLYADGEGPIARENVFALLSRTIDGAAPFREE